MKLFRRSRQRHLRHAVALGFISLFEGLVRIVSLGHITTDLREWYIQTELNRPSEPPDQAGTDPKTPVTA